MSEGLPDRVHPPNAAPRAPPRGPRTARRSKRKPVIRIPRPATASSVPSDHTSDSAPSLSEPQQPASNSQDGQVNPLTIGGAPGGISDQIDVTRGKDVDKAKSSPAASRCQTSVTNDADGSQRNWCRGFELQHVEPRTQTLDDVAARKAAGANVSSEPPHSVCSEAKRTVYGLNSRLSSSTPLGKRKRILPTDHSREIGAKSKQTARHGSAKPSPTASRAEATHSSIKQPPRGGHAARRRSLFGQALPASRRQGAAARSQAMHLAELKPHSLDDNLFLENCGLFVNEFLGGGVDHTRFPDAARPETQPSTFMSTNAEQSRPSPANRSAAVRPERDKIQSRMNGGAQNRDPGKTVPEGWPTDAYMDLTQDDSDSSDLASIEELVPRRNRRTARKQSPQAVDQRPQQADHEQPPQAVSERPPPALTEQTPPAVNEKTPQGVGLKPQVVCQRPPPAVNEQTPRAVGQKPQQVVHQQPLQTVHEQPQQDDFQQPRQALFERLPHAVTEQPQENVSEQPPDAVCEPRHTNENIQTLNPKKLQGTNVEEIQEHNSHFGGPNAGEPQIFGTNYPEDVLGEPQGFDDAELTGSDYAPSKESSSCSSIAPTLDSEDLEVNEAPRESTPPMETPPKPEAANAIDFPYICKLPIAKERKPKSIETLEKLVDLILDRIRLSQPFGSTRHDLRINTLPTMSPLWHERKAREIAARPGRKAWFGKVAERQRWAEQQQDALRQRREPWSWMYPRGRDFAISWRVQQKLAAAKHDD